MPKNRPTKLVNSGRHAAECKICAHAHRHEIERDFINWHSPASIAKQYGLRNRSTVYRHAHAVGLFPKRERNVRAALEKIIERAGEVDVTASLCVNTSPYVRATAFPVSESTGNSSAFCSASVSDWSGVCGETATSVAPLARISASARWNAASCRLQ